MTMIKKIEMEIRTFKHGFQSANAAGRKSVLNFKFSKFDTLFKKKGEKSKVKQNKKKKKKIVKNLGKTVHPET